MGEKINGNQFLFSRPEKLTDQSNFFRNFKAIYGMTPLVYRKKQGQADFMRVL